MSRALCSALGTQTWVTRVVTPVQPGSLGLQDPSSPFLSEGPACHNDAVVSTDGAVCAIEGKPSVPQWVLRRCSERGGWRGSVPARRPVAWADVHSWLSWAIQALASFQAP